MQWWRDAVFYRVYVPSFTDSDGDGLGDLPGIRDRLGYLELLGVDALCLSPVCPSPMVDHGYDVSDPSRVRAELGGDEARERFVAALRRHGLGLIADIVPNHVALEGNAWWIDVLTHGTASACFPYFDIDLSHDPDAGPAPAGSAGAAMSPLAASAARIRGRSCPVISTWRGLDPS